MLVTYNRERHMRGILVFALKLHTLALTQTTSGQRSRPDGVLFDISITKQGMSSSTNVQTILYQSGG
jgi:hypothetical protein